jgi:uncharacterized protein YdaT
MTYTINNYPEEMKRLPMAIRRKAIHILNGLLSDNENLPFEQAIALSIKKARKWAEKAEPETQKKPHGERYYVVPHHEGWAVKGEIGSKVAYAYNNKDKALSTAENLARENKADLIIQNQDGSEAETRSYF